MALDLVSIAILCALIGDGAAPPKSERISGVVHGTHTGPIGGARVWIVPSRPFRWEFDSPAPKLAETLADGGGRFEIEVPARSGLVDVGAEAAGFRAGAALAVAAGETIELALDRSFSWVGVVRDVQGRPIAGARFVAQAGAGALVVERTATTDEHGAYRLESVPGDERRLLPTWINLCSLEASGFAPASPSMRFFAEQNASDFSAKECRVDFWLGRGAELAGAVTDRETGRPIEGAHLLAAGDVGWLTIDSAGTIVSRPPGLKPPRAITDRQGAFRLQHLPWSPESSGAGAAIGAQPPVQFLAFAPGYVVSVFDVTPTVEGASLRIDVALERAGGLRITAPPVAGPMLPRTRVRVDPERPPDPRLTAAYGTLLPYRRELPADGRVELAGVPRGRCTVRIEVTDLGGEVQWRSPDREVLVAAGAVTEVPPFELPSSVAIRAYLSDESGAPLAGADVTASSSPGRYHFGTSDSTGRVEIAAPSDEFAGVTSCRLRVAPHGFAPRFVEAPRTADGTSFEVPVRFERLVRWSGTCRRGDGQPEAGAQVDFLDGSLPLDEALARSRATGPAGDESVLLGFTVTDEAGTFRSPRLPEGRAHVVARREGSVLRRTDREEVVLPNLAPTGNLAIRFSREKDPATPTSMVRPRPRSVVDLRLTDASSGEPIRQVERLWIGADDLLAQSSWFVPVAPGRFRLLVEDDVSDLAAHSSSTRLDVRGFVPGHVEARVSAERQPRGTEPRIVECALASARTLRFRADPERFGFTMTMRVERLPDLALVATADPDVVRDLPAGRYRVCSGSTNDPVCGRRNDWIASETIDVAAGTAPSHRDVIVHPVKAGTLTVRWGDRFAPAVDDHFDLRAADGTVVASLDSAPPDGWSRLFAIGAYEFTLSRRARAPLTGSIQLDEFDVTVELSEE